MGVDNMADKKLILDTDNLDIESERFIEVPIKGPGEANRLVVLNGIALSGVIDNENTNADTLDSISTSPEHWTVLIHTKYRLTDADRWQNIVNGNTELLQATWVSLCGVAADEEGGAFESLGFIAALDSVSASINSTNRVRLLIRAGLQGDCTIMKIAYQVNFIIRKAL